MTTTDGTMPAAPDHASIAAPAPGAQVRVALLRVRPDQDSDIPPPRYMTPLAAGADLCAAVAETMIIPPGTRALIPTGFAIALPAGWEAQVRARSGLAHRAGIAVLNGPGTIDADYRGEISVLLINHGKESASIRRGERIAQLVVQPCFRAVFDQVDALDTSERNQGGFGSTGS